MTRTTGTTTSPTLAAPILQAGIYFEPAGSVGGHEQLLGTYDFSNSSLDSDQYRICMGERLHGHFASYTEDLAAVRTLPSGTWAWFGQDTWKVSRTLSWMGLRFYRVTWPLQSDGVASESLSRFDPTWHGNPPVSVSPDQHAVRPGEASNPLTAVFFSRFLHRQYRARHGEIPATQSHARLTESASERIRVSNPTKGFRDSLPAPSGPPVGISWDPFAGEDGDSGVFRRFPIRPARRRRRANRGPALSTPALLSADITPTQFQPPRCRARST